MKLLTNMTAFGMMGLIVSGTVFGFGYNVVVLPAMALYTMAFLKVLSNFSLVEKVYTIKHSYILTGILTTVYSLFMFQCATIIMTGDTLFPTLWWTVHGGAAIYIYITSHLATRE